MLDGLHDDARGVRVGHGACDPDGEPAPRHPVDRSNNTNMSHTCTHTHTHTNKHVSNHHPAMAGCSARAGQSWRLSAQRPLPKHNTPPRQHGGRQTSATRHTHTLMHAPTGRKEGRKKMVARRKGRPSQSQNKQPSAHPTNQLSVQTDTQTETAPDTPSLHLDSGGQTTSRQRRALQSPRSSLQLVSPR